MHLNYKVIGEGKPLIILHGLFGMLDNWQTLGKKWAEQYQVVMVDQRNHGHSPWSDTFSYAAMVADLEDLLDELELTDVSLLGHSMGGKVSMKFAQNHPTRVQHLIVADIAPRAYPVHHHTVLDALQAVPLHKITSRKEAEFYLSKHIDQERIRQFFLKNLYWVEKGRLGWRFNLKAISANIDEVGAENMDGMFSCHTLFLRGGLSPYITEEDIKDIPLIFPNSEIQTIEGAGHWLHAEKPIEFYQKVSDFLKKDAC